MECVTTTNLIRDGGPAQSATEVTGGERHEVGGGEGGGDEGGHGVREHGLDHRLGHGHNAHAPRAQEGRGREQIPELRGLEQVVHMDAGSTSGSGRLRWVVSGWKISW